MKYSAWAENYPVVLQMCAYVNDYGWENTYCTASKNALCERHDGTGLPNRALLFLRLLRLLRHLLLRLLSSVTHSWYCLSGCPNLLQLSSNLGC